MTYKEAKEKLYIEWQKFLEDNIDYAGISDAYKTAFKALEQEPNTGHWIPVIERLPEENGLYLVYTEEQSFVCSFVDGEFFIDEVLAWMPLPKPYESQERSGEEI